MLTEEIKILNNYKPSINKIKFSGVRLSDDKLFFQLEDAANLKGTESVTLYRQDGKRIYYTERKEVYFGENYIEMPMFSKRVLLRDFSASMRKTMVNITPSETGNTEDCMIVQFKNEHCLITNRDDVEVKGYIVDGNDSIGRGLQRCDSDIVLASLNQDRYDRAKDNYFLIYDGRCGHVTAETENYHCEGIDNVQTDVVGSNGKTYKAIVPVDANGQDYSDTLIILASDSLEDITYFLCNDERFVQYGKNSAKLDLQPNVWGEYIDDSLSFSLPIGQDFSLKMNHAEEVEAYAELMTERSINSIVDYERYQFSPYFLKHNGNDELYPATEIEFNLHFRERDADNGWKVKSDGFWNSYSYNEIGNSLSHITSYNGDYLSDSDSDLFGQIGFDDEDIKYQSKSLQQSFLRLSFYDTPYRGNQNLLFYNTLFVNTSHLFSKYTKAVATTELQNKEYCQYQWESGNPLRMGASFSAHDKYTASGSSEGFYIYLFKGLLTDGVTSSTIYMKAEFNHAKYGTIVPFILPRTAADYPISPISKEFPINYYDAKNKRIDMLSFNYDMYIPITIQYIEKTDEYIWRSPIVQKDGKMVFNLFEPRLNPTTATEVTSRSNGDVITQNLSYSEDENCMVGESLSIRDIGEKRICSKRFLNTVSKMSINGKIVNKASKIVFSAASSYEIVYELNNSEVVSGAFTDIKNITRLRFNNNITKIGSSVAANTSVNELILGKNITEIGNLAFSKNISLGSIDLSKCDGLKTIGISAFQSSTGLHEILLPSHAIIIQNSAFGRTAIRSITIPDGSEIGRFAFSRCYHLNDVSKFGDNLKLKNHNENINMDDKAVNGWGIFANCKRLITTMNVSSNKTEDEMKDGDISYETLYKKFGLDTTGMKTTYEEDKMTAERKISWLFQSRWFGFR